MPLDRLRQVLVLLGAVAQIVGALLVPLGVQEIAIGERTEPVRTPVVPAGYAFSIWGVIFAACAAFAVWHALPGRARDSLARRVGWWAAVAFLANAAWEVLAQAGVPEVLLLAVIVVALAAAATALLRTCSAPDRTRGGRWWLVALPLGLLAGWLSAAAFANLSTALEAARVGPWPEWVWLAVIVCAAAFACIVAQRARGQLAYAAAVVWALIAVVVVNLQAGQTVAALTAGAGVLAVAGVTLAARRLTF